MPFQIVCPKCKKQLRVADTVVGKKIKCPSCAAVFLAGKSAPAPASVAAPAPPQAVTPPPVLEPTVAPGPSAGMGSAETPSASPSRNVVKKKKSNALHYGCLTGVFVVLLVIGLGIAGVFWLLNKGKNAVEDWASAVTTRKTTDHQPSPPGANEQPVEEKRPAKAPAALDAEIATAGAGVKLVKLDLSSAGLPLTIDAPEGAIAKESYGYAIVTRGQNFTVKLVIGRDDLAEKKKAAFGKKTDFESRDLLLLKGGLLGDSAYQFGLNVTAGHRDYFIENLPIVDRKPVTHRKDDCLLMIKCACTLAPKTPPPADPVAALQQLKINVEPDGDKKITLLNMGRNASDTTLVLVKKLPDLRTLILEAARIHDDGLAHLADRTQLKHLNLGSTRITDAGLKHLSGLTNLETLDLSGVFVSLNITNAGLKHLAGLRKLQTLDLGKTKIDDAGLAQLKTLSALKSLGLSGTAVTGAGLVHLKDIATLTSLRLYRAKVTDAGLAGLRGVPNLKQLSLSDTQIDDAGLAHLRELKKLEELSLDRTRITDAGLAHLKELKELEKLHLDHTAISDAGLKHLEGLPKLDIVTWDKTRVVDGLTRSVKPPVPFAELKAADPLGMLKRVGGSVEVDENCAGKPIVAVGLQSSQSVTDLDLADLRDLKQLRVLTLAFDGKITDAGLPYLAGLTNLQELNLLESGVKGDGFTHLKGLTRLKKLELPNRTYSLKQLAPLAVLVNLERFDVASRGDVNEKMKILAGMTHLKELNIGGLNLKDASLTPLRKMTELEKLQLWAGDGVTDSGLSCLKGMTRMRSLILSAPITAAGMNHLSEMTDLQVLSISSSRLSNAGFEHLAKMKKLEELDLRASSITGPGLAMLRNLPHLHKLALSATPITDRGLEHLKGLTELEELELSNTNVTGTGLVHLTDSTKLRELRQGEAKMTDAGLAALKPFSQLQVLYLVGAPITDAGLAHLKGLNELRSLTLSKCKGVTDAGMVHLKGLAKLKSVNLRNTNVTANGARELKKALPKVEIEQGSD